MATAESPVVPDRAIELATNTPKTPEAFLHMVRTWMDDPYMDGYAFAERISGIEREKWTFILKHLASNETVSSYSTNNHDTTTDYDIRGIQITSKNHLWDIDIPIHQSGFCINEEMVPNILGKPNRIIKMMPSKYSEFTPDYSPIIYFLYKKNQYEITFTFSFDESKFGNIIDLTAERKNEISAYINDSNNNKDICATIVRLGTYEGRKERKR